MDSMAPNCLSIPTVKVIIVSANEVSTCENFITAVLPSKYKYKI